MIRRLIICLVAAISMAGCFKDEIYQTQIIMECYEQVASGDTNYGNLDGVVAHSFAADTAQYIVANYEDAVAGILTNKVSGERLRAATTSQVAKSDSTSAISLVAEGEKVVLVAADTRSQQYAYTNYKVGLNLATTYMTILFRPWKEEDFTQNKWRFITKYQLVTAPSVNPTERE